MNKFKSAITAWAGYVVVVTAVLLISPSVLHVQGSQDHAQCEFLKQKITAPRDNKEKNNRNYYCNEMQRLSCSEYENLCEDKSGKSGDKTSFDGTWVTTATHKDGLGDAGAVWNVTITFTTNKDITQGSVGGYTYKGMVSGQTFTFDYYTGKTKYGSGELTLTNNNEFNGSWNDIKGHTGTWTGKRG